MATKSAPKLDLPDCTESAIFRTFENVLKNDPVFWPVTNYSVFWHDDDKPFNPICWALCPYFMMKPYPQEGNWVTEGMHDSPLMIHITMAVKGTDVTQLMNYWATVRHALFPQASPTAYQAIALQFQNACAGTGGTITKPTLQMSAYGPMVDDEGMRLLVAEGVIRFGVNIFT